MKHRLELGILPQPDGTTCGPTCLHAVYRYHGDDVPLQQTIDETHRLDEGGTYAVFLAQHALRRGYRATIYTYNLRVFDPTWFGLSREAMLARLELRRQVFAHKPKLETVMRGYAEFLTLGGDVLLEDLTPGLIRRYLNRGIPILTGLSSTYLYRAMREHGANMDDDDVRGDPQGHFVVLCGYDKEDRTVLVADPMSPNPAFQGLTYVVNIERVLCSILLGVMTQDAELLILEPPERRAGSGEGDRGDDRPAGGSAGKEARSPWPS